MGKHKPIFDAAGWPPQFTKYLVIFDSFSSSADCGDYVVVTNAKKVKVSGRKEEQILYRKHTMYPGGLKEIKYKEMMKRKPDEVCNGGLGSLFCLICFRRSSVRQCPECCPKTSYGRGD